MKIALNNPQNHYISTMKITYAFFILLITSCMVWEKPKFSDDKNYNKYQYYNNQFESSVDHEENNSLNMTLRSDSTYIIELVLNDKFKKYNGKYFADNKGKVIFKNYNPFKNNEVQFKVTRDDGGYFLVYEYKFNVEFNKEFKKKYSGFCEVCGISYDDFINGRY